MREHLRSVIFQVFPEVLQSDKLCTNKMQGKYVLVALMISFNHHIASSHILTSAYMDMSLPTCMRILTYTVMNDLCPTYGAYGDYSSEVNVQPIPKELTMRQWEHRENVIKKCCAKPCSLPDLLSAC
uniref:Insulin-like domain-containing protein n=1 Tax=Heliothis virescens TaxID=7102 RepID=A0A2A4JLV0_HELVI